MATLELGAQIPGWHWDWSVAELRDFAQGAEAIGFDWLGMTDHVLYAYATETRPAARYAGGTIQHEPLSFLAWVAGVTQRVALTTSVIVVPQRQAVLLAKQAAEVDLLSGGRLRLGVGIGWQESEFDALEKGFGDRGQRMESDVALMRACWRQEPIDFDGTEFGAPELKFEQMSMLPKPVQPGGPPILFGGVASRAIERAARLGDGWIAMTAFESERAQGLVDRMSAALAEQGRSIDAFPLQATTTLTTELDELRGIIRQYVDAGFSRLGLHLPSFTLEGRMSVDLYLRQLETVWREVWPEFQAG